MAYVTTQPEVVTYSGNGSDLQAAIDAACAAGKSLYIAPGTYDVWNLSVGNPLKIFGTPGKVVLRPVSGALYALYLGGFSDIAIEGITFDGADRTLTVDPGLPTRSLVAVKRGRAEGSRLRITNCTFRNSPHAGLQVYAVTAHVSNCRFEDLVNGICIRDGDGVHIVDNDFVANAGNAIYIDRADPVGNGVFTPGFDGTVVSGNRIETVTLVDPSSTGWEGNGVLLVKTAGTHVTDNVIKGCAFSAVRANCCNDTVITGNSCHAIGETAIYMEAVFSGISNVATGHGAVVTGNIVDDAAGGISIANYNNGGRLGLVHGNLLRNLTVKVVAAGTPNQYSTGGTGMVVEGDVNVNGNIIDSATLMGIVLGTNDFTDDLLCTDNLIRNAPIGIGFANTVPTGGRDAQIYIASNMIAHYTNDSAHGAIVPVSFTNAAGHYRVPGADIGQSDTSTTYPYVRVDRNRCF